MRYAVLNPEGITTLGLASSRFARRYFGNLFWFLFLRLLRCFSSAGVPTYYYFIHNMLSQYCCDGFPHSEICGSMLICSSPQLIAACHVLLRLLMPRHSPCALVRLTSQALLNDLSFIAFSWIMWVSFRLCYFQLPFVYLLYTRVLSEKTCFSYSPLYSILKHQYTVYTVLVEIRRIELLTPCLQGRCSPSWATPP